MIVSVKFSLEKRIFWKGSYHLAVFFAIYFSVHLLLHAPFAYYKTFKIEQKHGFKKESVTEFVIEELFSLAFCIAAFTRRKLLLWMVNGLLWNFRQFRHLPEHFRFPFRQKVGFPLREIYVVKANSSITEHVCTLGWWDFKYILLSDALVDVDRTADAKTARSAASSIVPEIQAIEDEWAGISVHTCEDDEASLPSTSHPLFRLFGYQCERRYGSARLGCGGSGDIGGSRNRSLEAWTQRYHILGETGENSFWIVALSSIFYPKQCFDGSYRINSFLFAQIFSAALHVVLCQLSRRMVFSADAFSAMWGYGLHLPLLLGAQAINSIINARRLPKMLVGPYTQLDLEHHYVLYTRCALLASSSVACRGAFLPSDAQPRFSRVLDSAKSGFIPIIGYVPTQLINLSGATSLMPLSNVFYNIAGSTAKL
uniref:CAAX prenyl protease 1 N-terminal domain-containing protein n=1 Tax=Ditylenchus dipsaci TaxID=166011 RepID=A0A915E566_9BILA